MVTKRRQNPPLGDLHRRLRLGLVFRFESACGNDCRTVVASKFMIGRIDLRFIVTGLGHAGFEVVGNEDLRNAADELKRPDIGLDPGGKILGKRSPGKRVAAGAQGGDKQARLAGLSGNRIHYRDRLASIIDKELFPGPMRLAKAHVEFAAPLVIMETKLAVLITFGVGRFVFQPQKPERHRFTGQFFVNISHVQRTPLLGTLRRRRWKQKGFQPAVVQIGGQGPTEPLSLGPGNVIPDGAAGNVTTLGDLIVG